MDGFKEMYGKLDKAAKNAEQMYYYPEVIFQAIIVQAYIIFDTGVQICGIQVSKILKSTPSVNQEQAGVYPWCPDQVPMATQISKSAYSQYCRSEISCRTETQGCRIS